MLDPSWEHLFLQKTVRDSDSLAFLEVLPISVVPSTNCFPPNLTNLVIQNLNPLNANDVYIRPKM